MYFFESSKKYQKNDPQTGGFGCRSCSECLVSDFVDEVMPSAFYRIFLITPSQASLRVAIINIRYIPNGMFNFIIKISRAKPLEERAALPCQRPSLTSLQKSGTNKRLLHNNWSSLCLYIALRVAITPRRRLPSRGCRAPRQVGFRAASDRAWC